MLQLDKHVYLEPSKSPAYRSYSLAKARLGPSAKKLHHYLLLLPCGLLDNCRRPASQI